MNASNTPPPFPGEGEPYRGPPPDRRLTVLETRFDTILPTLATKADLEALRGELRLELVNLRAEMHAGFEKLRAELAQGLNSHMKWMIATMLTFFIGIAGLNIAIFNTLSNSINTLNATVATLSHSVARIESRLAREGDARSAQDSPSAPAPHSPPPR